MITNQLRARRWGRRKTNTTLRSGTYGEAGQGGMVRLFLMYLNVSDDFSHLVLYGMQKPVDLDGQSLGDQLDAAVG